MVNAFVRRTFGVDMFPRLARLAALVAGSLTLLAIAATGALYVTTLPTGADVWLDGTYIGHSPVILDALSTGRHTVSLNRTGWNSVDVDVSVVAGTTSLTSVALRHAGTHPLHAGDGSFSIRGLVPRALLLDGAAIVPDKLGLYNAPSGVHELVAQTPGGRMTRSVTIYPEMRTDVVLHGDETAQHSPVVAPASDYLPLDAYKIAGSHIVIRHAGHQVDATLGALTYRYDGRSVTFDAAPTLIGAALYLPLELLKELTANDAKAN